MKDTLEAVLVDMTMHGSDRGSLVRHAQDGKAATVCVVMTSKAALAKLGPPIRDLASKLGSAGADFGMPAFDHRIGLGALFDMGSEAPNGWCWAMFRYHELDVTLAIFSREVEELARICTSLGVPCSLNPKVAADGYTIRKEIRSPVKTESHAESSNNTWRAQVAKVERKIRAMPWYFGPWKWWSLRKLRKAREKMYTNLEMFIRKRVWLKPPNK